MLNALQLNSNLLSKLVDGCCAVEKGRMENGEGGEGRKDGRKRRFVCCKQRSNAAKHVTVVVYGNVKVSWLIYLTIFCILVLCVCIRSQKQSGNNNTRNSNRSIKKKPENLFSSHVHFQSSGIIICQTNCIECRLIQ